MKPTLTLLLALLLIGGIGYVIRQCKELNRNGFGKKNEL